MTGDMREEERGREIGAEANGLSTAADRSVIYSSRRRMMQWVLRPLSSFPLSVLPCHTVDLRC